MNTPYDHITHKIIGCAMAVHTELGNGFREVIYQRCMNIEMTRRGIPFVREEEMPITYQGVNVGSRRVDFLVEECVLVELKAVVKLEDVHLSQGINYLEAFKLDAGLLINFGAPRLEFKRLFRKRGAR